MHEMGEIKRAQENRIDEVSVQKKLRENHETIQQLTSQLQHMQEQMNLIFKMWKVVSRFQPTYNDSEFSFRAQPRQKIAAWRMELSWITRKRFWKCIFYLWFTEEIPPLFRPPIQSTYMLTFSERRVKWKLTQ